MTIDHLLAVVPVSDLQEAHDWYTRLFGRPADNRPMETLVEWQVIPTAWVQVFHDPERAGRGLLNLAVADVDAQVGELAGRGIIPDEESEATKGVSLRRLSDPDGNQITLIGGFRPVY